MSVESFALGMLVYEEDTFNLVLPHEEVPLASLSAAESILFEQQMLGLSPGEHPMSLYRLWLDEQNTLDSRQLGEAV